MCSFKNIKSEIKRVIIAGKEEEKADSFGREHLGVNGKRKLLLSRSKFSVKG